MNRDTGMETDETPAAAAEPMILSNSLSAEENIRWINSSVLAKAKLLEDAKAKSRQMEQELKEKVEKARCLREQNKIVKIEVTDLEFREREALATLRKNQQGLDEARREVEHLQRLLKEQKKTQAEKLAKYEDDMCALSEKFAKAPIVNNAQALEVELKVLQATSEEVRDELVAVRQELLEVSARYSLMTDAAVVGEPGEVADDHNCGGFIKRVIEEMQAEVSREKIHCGNLTEHMLSLQETAANMRRELDNIKAKK